MRAAILVVVIAVLAAGVSSLPQDKYTTKYDHIKTDDILRNPRLFNVYVNCLLEKGPCSADGNELRRILPDAVETQCQKCNERQKERSESIIKFLIDNRPEVWMQIETKYDPTGITRKRLGKDRK